MRWLRAIAAKALQAGQAAASYSVSLVSGWVSSGLWTIRTAFLDLATRAYGGNAVVYSCLRLLSQSIPEPPLVAYQERAGERTALDPTHPFQVLLSRPNELMTGYEMVEMIVLQLAFGGSYWWKQRGNGGRPVALWPLRPDRVGPIYSTSNEAGQRLLSGWAYHPPGGGSPLPIPRADMIAFGFPDPAGETGGVVESLGWMQVLASEISADNEATSFVGALLANAGQPSLLIKTQTPISSEDEARRIKRQFMTQLTGSHRGEPALVDIGTEIEKLSFDLQQLEFPDLRSISESRISAAAGVPAILVGLKVGLDSATYSNVQGARAFFAETTCTNYWVRIGMQLSADLAPEFGADLLVAFDTANVAALADQRIARMAPVVDAYKGGAITVNEYRQRLGFEPIDGQDVFLRWMAQLEVQKDKTGNVIGALAEAEAQAALTAAPRKALPAPATKALTSAAVERLANRTRERHRQAFATELAADFADLADTVEARYRASAKAEELVTDADTKRIGATVEKLWQAVLSDAYSDVSLTLDVDLAFDIQSPNVARVMQQVTIGRYPELTDYSRARVREVIQRKADEGLSIDETAKILRDDYAFSAERAETVARTESAVAYNKGSLLGYAESGLVESVYVMDGLDFDTPCISANGQTWTLERAEAEPIQHPRCRRAFAPVLKS